MGDSIVYGPATPSDQLTLGSVVQLADGSFAQVGSTVTGAVTQASQSFSSWASANSTTLLIAAAAIFGLMLFTGGRR